MDQRQFRAMLQRLLEKTQADRVNWHFDEDPMKEFYVHTQHTSTCAVRFASDVEIVLTRGTPPEEREWIEAVLRIGGRAVHEQRGEDGQDMEEFLFLKRLWQDAERRAIGWDRALKAINDALASDGTIGLPPRQDEDDGVPF